MVLSDSRKQAHSMPPNDKPRSNPFANIAPSIHDETRGNPQRNAPSLHRGEQGLYGKGPSP